MDKASPNIRIFGALPTMLFEAESAYYSQRNQPVRASGSLPQICPLHQPEHYEAPLEGNIFA
jgi:hypothetical protein